MRLAVLHFFPLDFAIITSCFARTESTGNSLLRSFRVPAIFLVWLPKKAKRKVTLACLFSRAKSFKMEGPRNMWNFVLPLLFLWSTPIGKLREMIKKLQCFHVWNSLREFLRCRGRDGGGQDVLLRGHAQVWSRTSNSLKKTESKYYYFIASSAGSKSLPTTTAWTTSPTPRWPPSKTGTSLTPFRVREKGIAGFFFCFLSYTGSSLYF